MIIHECVNIDTSGNGNIYMLELFSRLLVNEDVSHIYPGTYFFEHPVLVPDIMHIHWPEQLTGHQEPTARQLIAVEQALKKTKANGTRICYTVHDLHSHYSRSKKNDRLYQMAVSYADALIHFSGPSIGLLKQAYQQSVPALESTRQVVIAHGNYLSHQNHISPAAARKVLNINSDETVVLVFGAIRHKEEIDLIMQAFNRLPLAGKRLVVAGENYTTNKIENTGEVTAYDRMVTPSQIQLFMNAADILLLPRLNTLNSGLLYLGFSFGKVVVGPNAGNIGELLSATGNFTFDPDNMGSVAEAIQNGLAASKTALGENNKSFAATTGDWNKIAGLHIDLFKAMLSV